MPHLFARVFLPMLSVLLVLWAPAAHAQVNSIAYEISFPNAAHHEAEVSVTVTGVPVGNTAALHMSRTSPGRYALHEFAKNVYNVRAFDGEGRPLAITQPNLHQWNVTGHDGTVRVTYTLFGNRADGTYTGIDNTHAHLNIPATFMWPPNAWDVPISLTIHKPDPTWNIATQLMPTGDGNTFLGLDLYYFLDSPIEVSPFTMRTWEVSSHGRSYTIRLAVHHTGTEAEVDAYAEMAQKVVAEQIALFGETPAYEGGQYTFIADYLPWVHGDGMEHRNSTILTSTGTLADNMIGLLGTLSHEFFHQWNVERLRPRTLEPFHFKATNLSDALWFAEGFTSYYDDLTIRRAGLISDSAYAADLGGTLNYVLNAPGSRFYSPVEMSLQAPFVDAATSVDPQNKANTFISYYAWGSVLGLALDLTLRTRYDVTLDDYMRVLWKRFGKRETPYMLTDLRYTLNDLTDDPAFADDFFDRHIYGSEMPDYASLLANAGYILRTAHPGQPWHGGQLAEVEGTVTVAQRTLIGTPLYDAGLDQGDVLLALDGQPVPTLEAVNALIDAHQPGDALSITFEQRGERKEATLTLAENPQLEVVPFEAAGRPITDAIQAFRTAWLGSKAEG